MASEAHLDQGLDRGYAGGGGCLVQPLLRVNLSDWEVGTGGAGETRCHATRGAIRRVLIGPFRRLGRPHTSCVGVHLPGGGVAGGGRLHGIISSQQSKYNPNL